MRDEKGEKGAEGSEGLRIDMPNQTTGPTAQGRRGWMAARQSRADYPVAQFSVIFFLSFSFLFLPQFGVVQSG